jgi:hypothetical protein
VLGCCANFGTLAQGGCLSIFCFNFARRVDVLRLCGYPAWGFLLCLQANAKVVPFNRPRPPFYKSLQNEHSWSCHSHSTLCDSDILNNAQFLNRQKENCLLRECYISVWEQRRAVLDVLCLDVLYVVGRRTLRSTHGNAIVHETNNKGRQASTWRLYGSHADNSRRKTANSSDVSASFRPLEIGRVGIVWFVRDIISTDQRLATISSFYELFEKDELREWGKITFFPPPTHPWLVKRFIVCFGRKVVYTESETLFCAIYE